MSKIIVVIVFIISIFLFLYCSENSTNVKELLLIDSSTKIVFIELGSETCIPCMKMRPIMDSIQKKYGNQILVKFIDAIQNSQEAKPYKIRMMPTQVFLDSNKNEIYRHEGFFPEDSIHLFLQSKGLKIIN
jgi:thioredoxin 1